MVSDTLMAAYVSGAVTIGLAVGWRGFLKPLIVQIRKNTNFREWFTGESVEGGDGELTRMDKEFKAFHSELADLTAEQARHREERIEEHENVLDHVHALHRTLSAIADAFNRSPAIEAEIPLEDLEPPRPARPDGSDGPFEDASPEAGEE